MVQSREHYLWDTWVLYLCAVKTGLNYLRSKHRPPCAYTMCYHLPPVFSSSDQHSDVVVCVALEFINIEGGLSCCWVTELQEGLPTSLMMVDHSGGVETVGSWT